MRRFISVIGLFHFLLGNAFAQQIPLQTFNSAGGGTGSVYSATSVPTHFSSIGQPFVLGRPISTNNGGGVMTANEFMFLASTIVAPLPTAQPTALLFTSVTTTSLTVSFTSAAGNPAGYIVIRKSGAAPLSAPAISVSYLVNDALGDATVVYVGNATTFNDTGLSPGTTYYYAVFSFNGSGATLNYLTTNPLTSNQTTTSVVDTTPPQITGNSTPASVALNDPVSVSVTVVDNQSTVNKVTISYGPTNSATLTAQGVDMTNTSGNVWQFSIPGTSVTELGLTYKIQATSSGGSTALTSYSTVISYTGSGLTIPYASPGSDISNYRIVAVPLDLSAKTVNDVFGDNLGPYGDKTKWRMYRYDNGSTNELSGSTSIDAGKGYWLIVKAAGATIDTGNGTTVQTNSDVPYSIPLKADWNEIGNPYNFNVSWADVQAANPGLPGLRKYNGDFIDGSQLNSTEGGFVKVSTAQTLTIPVVKNASVNGGRAKGESPYLFKNPLNEPNWQVYLTLQQGNLFNRISGFGMNTGASVGFDRFDGFTMPRFLEPFLEVNHEKKEGVDHYSSDIVPDADNHIWEFSIESSFDERRMIFSWDNSYFGNNDREIFLWDVALQRGLDMRKFDRYEFDKNQSTSFKAVYGSMDFVKEELSVKNLLLQGVFPNPAEGDVTIAFTMPESTIDKPVSFEAVDVMGRKVWTHEVTVSSGYHELIWRRTNPEAQGVYVLQVKSGVETRQKRIVLK